TNTPNTTTIYTLSLHDALPIYKLFYLQHQSAKYFFTNQPNINRTLLLKMENVEALQLAELELDLLKKTISGSKLKVVLWPKKSRSEEHTSELQSLAYLVCRLLL